MIERSSDEVVAKRAQEGDMPAFEELYGRYRNAILNFIYRMIGNRQTAEEVAQEVFIKVYVNLRVFDTAKSFATWIYTIARNLAKNSLRDKKYFRNMSLEENISGTDEIMKLKDVIADTAPGPETIAEDADLAEEAQRVLNLLPEEYREVIALCSIQGLSYKEAAAILECSAATISVRLNEAKELFMKKLGMNPYKRK